MKNANNSNYNPNTLFRNKCLSLFEDYILRKIAQDETRVSYLRQKKNLLLIVFSLTTRILTLREM